MRLSRYFLPVLKETPAEAQIVSRHLHFGDQVRVCAAEDTLHLSGPFDSDISCDTLLDPANGGAGYYFTASDATPHHLWFYVNPDTSLRILEIGLYADDAQVAWINSGIEICAAQ